MNSPLPESLPQLNLPPAELPIATAPDGSLTIYDALRMKWVALTPEEWVRQRFVCWLTTMMGYPAARMGNEVSLRLNGALRRCDTVLYDSARHPQMIIEYKAPAVNITQATFNQALRYCIVMRPQYIAVSNGLHHYCCRLSYDPAGSQFLESFPTFEQL